MTRARKRCEIFSNLASRDIRLTGSQGVEVLKRFLHYAETGKLVSLPHQRGGFGSPFEEAVYQELTKLGHEVHSQVGVAGYFIDLAIVNPDQPGSYLLGIECDGASYHSARSARDRDRLRQFVLEQHRGWRIHRIWSTDWFMNPNRQLERVVEAIERAKVAMVSVDSSPIAGLSPESPEEDSTPATKAVPLPTPPFEVPEASSDGNIDAESDTNIEATSTAGFTDTSLRVDRKSERRQPSEHVRDQANVPSSDDNEALDNNQQRALAIGARNCFALARWAKANGKFRDRDRNFLYNMGVQIRRASAPTPRQAKYLLGLYDQAIKEGFKSEE
jgi:very-short-patch-repair endonuclease